MRNLFVRQKINLSTLLQWTTFYSKPKPIKYCSMVIVYTIMSSRCLIAADVSMHDNQIYQSMISCLSIGVKNMHQAILH
jgi:hypothetical protein